MPEVLKTIHDFMEKEEFKDMTNMIWKHRRKYFPME